jgi:hypothetical protein
MKKNEEINYLNRVCSGACELLQGWPGVMTPHVARDAV